MYHNNLFINCILVRNIIFLGQPGTPGLPGAPGLPGTTAYPKPTPPPSAYPVGPGNAVISTNKSKTKIVFLK